MGARRRCRFLAASKRARTNEVKRKTAFAAAKSNFFYFVTCLSRGMFFHAKTQVAACCSFPSVFVFCHVVRCVGSSYPKQGEQPLPLCCTPPCCGFITREGVWTSVLIPDPLGPFFCTSRGAMCADSAQVTLIESRRSCCTGCIPPARKRPPNDNKHSPKRHQKGINLYEET